MPISDNPRGTRDYSTSRGSDPKRPSTRGGDKSRSTTQSATTSPPRAAAGQNIGTSNETSPQNRSRDTKQQTPVVVTARVTQHRGGTSRSESQQRRTTATPQPPSQRRPSAFLDDGDEDDEEEEEEDDDDESVKLRHAMAAFRPLQVAAPPTLPPAPEPALEVNIVVVGRKGVGKSTFIHRALGLSSFPSSVAAERNIATETGTYLVRLLEMPIEKVVVDDYGTVEWPGMIQNSIMPNIDGALTIYDVTEKDSLQEIRRVLDAINKSRLPSALISGKCDAPVDERELDPNAVERRAKQSFANLHTAQIGDAESCRRALSVILRAIVLASSNTGNQYSSARWILGEAHSDPKTDPTSLRRRAQSSSVQHLAPRREPAAGHLRAISDATTLHKDQIHERHDSSIADKDGTDHLKMMPPEAFDGEARQRTFLLEESGSEGSTRSSRSTISGDPDERAGAEQSSPSSPVEAGFSFEALVDRLLAQPNSKADSKFSAIFLALYRNFAHPGKLLSSIVTRFDGLEKSDGRPMIRTVEQLRYLAIMEQWLGTYPGDFAAPATLQTMRNFVAKIAQYRIFAVAAKEMSGHLDHVRQDDDTIWDQADPDCPNSTPEGVSDGSNENGKEASSATTKTTSLDSSFSHSLITVESAQRQVRQLHPNRREALTKVHWRMLMDLDDDLIAKELTRMDWVMFSAARPRDMVRQVALKGAASDRYQNVYYVNRMTEHFNHLAKWTANLILLRDKPKHRAAMLEKFMRIARKLRELNNYNSLGAIIAGVTSSAVYRLGATRELVPPAVAKDWLKLEILMSSTKSFSSYRLAWENSTQERIPYIPLHRRDLASAEQGNKTFIGNEADGRINWSKFEVMGEVIVSIQRAQGTPYKPLGSNWRDPLVKDLLFDVKIETDEEALWGRSLQCEPIPRDSATASSSKFIKDLFKRQ